MGNRVISVIIAAASAYLWFQPFNSFGIFFQSGQHWGGLAYGLLVLPALFAIAALVNQKSLAVVFSILSVLLTGQFILQIGVENIGWGLVGLAVCSFVSVLLASSMSQKSRVA